MSDEGNKPNATGEKKRRRRRRRGGRGKPGGGSAESSGATATPKAEGGQGEPGRRRRRRRKRPEGGSAGGSAGKPAAPRKSNEAGGGSGEGQPRRRRRRRGGRGRGDRQQSSQPQPRNERRSSAAFPAASAERVEFPDETDWDVSGDPLVPALTNELTSGELGGGSHDSLRALGLSDEFESPLEVEAQSTRPDLFVYPERSEDEDPADSLPPLSSEAGQLVNAAVVSYGVGHANAWFNAGELQLSKGEDVVVEGDRGLVFGRVVVEPTRMLTKQKFKRILRRVGERDADRDQKVHGEEQAQAAYGYCRKRIREHKLPMKLARVEYMQSGNKAIFYFSAEQRVDFRDLVKELGRELNTRVEMRQVGIRDGAKASGGLGPCGQSLCCSSFLQGFHPVGIRMAKDQNIALNPSKISGMCGRLKCCLAYEQSLYREARTHLPKVGKTVTTPDGSGVVRELDVPRGLVRVRAEDGTFTTYPANLINNPAVSKSGGSQKAPQKQ